MRVRNISCDCCCEASGIEMRSLSESARDSDDSGGRQIRTKLYGEV